MQGSLCHIGKHCELHAVIWFRTANAHGAWHFSGRDRSLPLPWYVLGLIHGISVVLSCEIGGAALTFRSLSDFHDRPPLFAAWGASPVQFQTTNGIK